MELLMFLQAETFIGSMRRLLNSRAMKSRVLQSNFLQAIQLI